MNDSVIGEIGWVVDTRKSEVNLMSVRRKGLSILLGCHLLLLVAASPTLAQTLSLCEAVDNCSLSWTTGGNASWFGQTSVVFFGTAAASSGNVGNSQSSFIQTSAVGPGTVRFVWKVSSENFHDILKFSIDGVDQADPISGEVDWQEKTYSLSSGTHSLRWTYSKDGSTSRGQDRGWLDKVEVTVIDNPPSVSFVSPTAGQTLSGTVLVQADATDDFGISRLELYIDGQKVSDTQSLSVSYSWNTLNLVNDTHTLRAVAFDTLGQTGEVQIQVKVLNQGSLPGAERNALVDLYSSTFGTGWINKNRWLSEPGTECSWYGVSCSPGNGHISEIRLDGNNLSGTLPASLANLTHLQVLSLSGNFLFGSIPAQLGSLSELRTLNLSNNQMSGSISAQIGNLANLSSLQLAGNRLSGSIPAEVGNLAQLTGLQLSRNGLVGGIPTGIGNLLQLRILELDQNNLDGPIPEQIGNLVRLDQLDLSSNQLNGGIPTQLGNLVNLKTLRLHSNQLIGPIPFSLGNLVRLQVLELYANRLNSSVPSDLGKLSELLVLQLNDNELNGAIPVQLGSLAKLVNLHLSNNDLSGTIPEQFGNLVNLTSLQLSNNDLSGTIPSSLGNLAKLERLELNSNHLSGVIPPQLGNLSKLVRLYLSVNNLTGNIPDDLGNLVALRFLALASNQLSGPLPESLTKLRMLESLELQSNQLSGEIPDPDTFRAFINKTGPIISYLDIRWNALYSTDSALTGALASKQVGGDWVGTQTIAPSEVSAQTISGTSIQLSWTPIAYTGDGGGYRVLYSTTHLGPYSLFANTADKTTGSMVVTGLKTSTTYYFVIQSFTETHRNNQNIVVSEVSRQVFATTTLADFPPSISVTSPSNGSVVAGPTTLAAAPSDDKGIARVEFFFDGLKLAEFAAAPYSLELDTTGYSNFTHVFRAKVTDTAGQTAEAQVTFTVSNPSGALYSWLLPSSARAASAVGGIFQTDLTISNTGLEDAQFTLKFLGNNTDGRFGPEVPLFLAAQKTVTYSDVLKTLFGLDSAFGALRLTSASPTLAVQGQTSVTATSGSYGQSVLALPEAALIPDGLPFSINAIREDDAFRTNLILANGTEAALVVDAVLLSEGGSILGTRSFTLQPLGMTQITRVVRTMGVSSSLQGARLELSTATAGGRFAAYAALIDNRTNDPRTLSPGSGLTMILPSSARVASLTGGLFTTDLAISNPSNSVATFTLKFLGNNGDGRSGPEVNGTIGAGQSVNYNDVLGSLFGLQSGFGALRLTSSLPLTMLGQTSIGSPTGGTYGQSVPGTDAANWIIPGLARSIAGIREDTAFRTNLVLANATEVAIEVDVTLVSGEGLVLATKRYALPPLGMTQVNRVVRDLGVGDNLVNARLVLTTLVSGGAFTAYAAEIDNVSNDPRTLLPQ
ncbi:MAG: Ig-like domain-containing protein [Acidobacteriota bacterium]